MPSTALRSPTDMRLRYPDTCADNEGPRASGLVTGGLSLIALPAIDVVESIGSTNDAVLALGRGGAPCGTAVASRRQTSGRGRRGHVWESPEGNLYLSVLLRPKVAPSRLPGLAAACGLGALDLLRTLNLGNEPQLKWPNDILVQNRKLAGILVEAARDDAGETFAVCGIGVNVAWSPGDLAATSLAELVAPRTAPSFSPLAHALRDAIVDRVDAWASVPGAEPLSGIRDDYVSALAWRGREVIALAPDGHALARGLLVDIDPWGRAVLETADGPLPLTAEQASLRPAA